MHKEKNNVIYILQQRSIQTLVVLIAYVFTAAYLPLPIHQGFYTASLLIKDVLMWVMPFTVGFFIAHAVQSFEHRAPVFILLLLLFEALSNFSSVWYAYVSATFAAEHLPVFEATDLKSQFAALWRLPFSRPSWWSAEKGSIIGLILGCISALIHAQRLKNALNRGRIIIEWVLTRIFARLIPLFILGFAAQMYQTNLLNHVISHYALLVLWLVAFILCYVMLLFALGAQWLPYRIVSHVKNLLPAGGIALTSGCSLSTMPWTIQGTAKNLQNPQLAQAIIPATTNIQQIGDCITQAFLCFLIYRHFNGVNPDLVTWLTFSIIFVLARYATAAVLGGAIFVMLPIYETYLGFTGEMIAIILALNVLLDPLVTSSNVMANGALCRIFERVWLALQPYFKRFLKARIPVENVSG